MSRVTVRFLGSGDAFGSGGRLQPCISLRSADFHLLLDCGASSMIALRQQLIDPNDVDAIVVSHLHGDHYGGLPYFILDAQFRRGAKPLLLAGPPGLRERLTQLMEASFPGSSRVERKFEMGLVELPAGAPTAVGPAIVTAHEVPHPSGAPAYALRVELAGRVIGYSGDGEWSESLPQVARAADLFICEAYYFDKAIKNHLNYAAIRQHRASLDCRRLILTHLSDDMLAHLPDIADEAAQDGLTIEL